jgi:hypothetical protein
VRVLENRAADGQRRWVDRTADAKIPPMSGVRWLLVHDVDHDGNLDLVVGLEKGVRVLRNLGAWAFEDVTARSEGLADLVTVAAVAGDFDGDGDSDLLCLTPGGTLTFLENLRGGRLRARADGPGFGRVHCLAMADLNNDGRPDLLLGLDTGVLVLLADPAQRLPLGARRLLLPTGAPVRQAGAFDHDNDGWQDVWAATDAAPRPLRLFRNLRGQRFDEVTDRLPELAGPILGVAAQDADGDGGLDLLLTRPDGVAPLHNVGANRNHWLALRLRAVLNTDEAGGGQAAKANYLNLGGTLEVSAGQLYQWRQVAGSVTHFGLGARPAAELARVVWTNGVPQDLVRPAVDRALTEPQRPKGSCPFLFAWDGAKFVMVTDCLWTSALGMQLAHGVFMPHDRQENYLVITDDQLRPRGGHYELRFTNELWEVPYLDQAELWVVEHPADVAIVTNQRIAPGQPPFKLHTVRDRRTPLTAVDHRGRDVLPEVRRADGRVAGGLTRKRYVGLTEPHWLELGLGDLRGAKRLTLYLAGWIWPTDTTANVAISQDPRFRGPTGVIGGTQAPVLQVPDGRGGWVTAVPDMGFPSGKLQTVAVPVPLDRFPADDYRVRIATAMELYWDEVYFTVDEPEVPVTIRKLPAAAADLRYRGYSRPYQDTPTGPHLFDYEDVDPRPIWLPRPGPYTRYGPVAELLARPDNRYVVMSPGDELALRFAALPPPPPGRRHTFLFYANGWLKDFDMNGGSSEAAGPLPFDGMSTYPYRAPETYPRTPEGEAFLRDFMTRTVDGAAYAGRMHPARQGRPSPEEARRRGTAGD